MKENILQLFSTFCQTTGLPFSGSNDNSEDIQVKPFQKLVFLIRDWGFPDTFDYGTETGQLYISRRLSSDPHQSDAPSKQSLHARKLINGSFQEINCGLLQSPGELAKLQNFQGRFDQLDRRFASKLRQFIQDLIILGGIPTKTRIFSSNEQMLPEEFVALIQFYVKAYNSNQIISPANIMEINILSSNEAAVQISMNYYSSEMSTNDLQKIYGLTQLSDIHSQLEEKAICKFKEFKKFGLPEQHCKFEAILKGKLKAAFTMIKRNYEQGESSKFAENNIKAKHEFIQKLETIMQLINLENPGQHIMELEDKTIQLFQATMQASNINLESERYQDFEQFIQAEGQEAKEKCRTIQTQADAYLQDAENHFQNKIYAKFTNYRQAVSDQIPADIFDQIRVNAKNEVAKLLVSDLRHLQVDKDSIGLIMEKFDNSATKKLDIFRTDMEKHNSEMHKIIESMLTTYKNDMENVIANNFFAKDRKFNHNLSDEIRIWHFDEKEKKINILEQASNSSSMKTRTKLRLLLTSKMESYLKSRLSNLDELQSKITQHVKLGNELFTNDIQGKLKSIDLNFVNASSQLDTTSIIQAHSEDLKLRLIQEIKKHLILPEPGIDNIILQIKQEWSSLADNLIKAKLQLLTQQESECNNAIEETRNLFFQNIQRYSTLEEFQKQKDEEIAQAMTCFSKFSKTLNSNDKRNAENNLFKLIERTAIEVTNNLTISSNAKTQVLEKIIENLVQEFLSNLDRQFPTKDSNNKTILYIKSEIDKFCTIQFAIASSALASQGNDCQASARADCKLELEKEFESLRNDKVIINTNNKRAFDELFKSCMDQVIKSIIPQFSCDENGSNLSENCNEIIILEVIKLINLGPYVIDENVVRPKILDYLTQNKQNIAQIFPSGMVYTPQSPAQFANIAGPSTRINSELAPIPQTVHNKEEPKISADKEIESIIVEYDSLVAKQDYQAIDFKFLSTKRQELCDAFATKLNSNGIAIGSWVEELKQALTKRQDEFEEAVRKLARQKFIDEDHAKTAYEFYKTEIEKHRSNCESSQFLTPKDLNGFHTSARNVTKAKFHDLTNEHATQLESLIEDYFQNLCLEQAENSALEPAIGIDLGTTFSCFTIFWEGQMTVIPNFGKRTTPSYVAFKPDGTQLVGEEAKNQAFIDPANTIFDGKRLIGRQFDDQYVQEDMKQWPFKVVQELGKPKIEVYGTTYHPEQIGAKILSNLKQAAEKFLKRIVTNAVVTVPAYFGWMTRMDNVKPLVMPELWLTLTLFELLTNQQQQHLRITWIDKIFIKRATF